MLSPQQLMLRRNGITGSEVAALAGLSRHTTPIKIFEGKTLPPKPDDELNIPMELGNDLEEPIARFYRRKTNTQTYPVATLQHPEKRFALCTPDRGVYREDRPVIVGEVTDQAPYPLLSLRQIMEADALLQCKSTSWRMRKEWGEPGTDHIPPEYLCQETWEMGITGHKSADVAVLFDKDRFEIYRVHFNADLFEGLYELAERFMADHVLALVPPEPDTSDAYADFIRRAFPKDKTVEMNDAPPELHSTVIRFAVLKQHEKTLKKALKLYGNRIRLVIGEDKGIRGPFGELTWTKNRDTTGTDWRKVAREAQLMAQMLLQKFGPQMEAKMRTELEQTLRELEAKHVTVTRAGARVLRPKWTDGFKADIAGETTVDFNAIAEDLAAEPPSDDEDVGGDE